MSNIDYKYTGKTNHFFTNGRAYPVTPDNEGEFTTKDDTDADEHGLSVDYLNKNFVKVFTQAMADNGELPSVGMKCNFAIVGGLWQDVLVNYISETLIVITDCNSAQASFLIEDSRFNPIIKKEKAVFDLMFHGCQKVNEPQAIELLTAIKAGKIHNVKWTGEQ